MLQYKKGILNRQADFLSWLMSLEEKSAPQLEDIFCYLQGKDSDNCQIQDTESQDRLQLAVLQCKIDTLKFNTADGAQSRQQQNPFCQSVWERLNGGGEETIILLTTTRDYYFKASTWVNKFCMLQILMERMLHFSRDTKVFRYPKCLQLHWFLCRIIFAVYGHQLSRDIVYLHPMRMKPGGTTKATKTDEDISGHNTAEIYGNWYPQWTDSYNSKNLLQLRHFQLHQKSNRDRPIALHIGRSRRKIIGYKLGSDTWPLYIVFFPHVCCIRGVENLSKNHLSRTDQWLGGTSRPEISRWCHLPRAVPFQALGNVYRPFHLKVQHTGPPDHGLHDRGAFSLMTFPTSVIS